MDTPEHDSVTRLLEAIDRGEPAAQDRLWEVLHKELRRLAQRRLVREPNETYIRLNSGEVAQFSNRRHLFAAAAETMRRILVDDARKRKGLKRGGGQRRSPLEMEPSVEGRDPAEILAIHEALQRLEAEDPRRANVVKHRYFVGLTVEETAEVLGCSPRTVESDWQFARVWLQRELGDTFKDGLGTHDAGEATKD
jgi:RNA polymerase sigma factor (TIGR02999 family)